MSDTNSILQLVQTQGGWGLLVLSLYALYRKDKEVKSLNKLLYEEGKQSHKETVAVLREHVDTNAATNKHIGEANILMGDLKDEMRRCNNDKR